MVNQHLYREVLEIFWKKDYSCETTMKTVLHQDTAPYTEISINKILAIPVAPQPP